MSGGTVVRAPNHLGDVVMALPAIRATGGADVVARRWLIPLLEMARDAEPDAAGIRGIVPLERGTRGLLDTARRLRHHRYELGLLLPPSLSSALLFTIGGVRRRRGFPFDARGFLLNDPVQPPPPGEHRAAGFMLLVTGVAERPTAVLPVPERERERWRAEVGGLDGPVVGISPGSHAPSRQWDPENFAEVVRRLTRRGIPVVVFGGPGEADLIRFVSGGRALEVGGRPDLPLLAAGLEQCALALVNDSGPMHVAAAVGTPTVALMGPSNPRLTGPLGEGHVLVRAEQRTPATADDLMSLISVDRVEAAVLGKLAGQPTRGG